ncbi:hypothetical protein [Limnohabitans sp.]|uniref:hypothetical protein n=1 Tax=Limnohabitans sp. TaxID=1907725 RepID=UPI0037BFBC94
MIFTDSAPHTHTHTLALAHTRSITPSLTPSLQAPSPQPQAQPTAPASRLHPADTGTKDST